MTALIIVIAVLMSTNLYTLWMWNRTVQRFTNHELRFHTSTACTNGMKDDHE